MGLRSPRWIGWRNDSLFIADSGWDALVITSGSMLAPKRIEWIHPEPREGPTYYPAMLLADGSIWVRYRGLENVHLPMAHLVFDRSGTAVDTLGVLRRTRKSLEISDPNGRVARQYRILHPVDYSSWTAVSADGRWAGLLNQEPSTEAVDSVELIICQSGNSKRRYAWAIPGSRMSGAEVSQVVGDLVRPFPAEDHEMLRSWVEYAFRTVERRAPVTGLTIGVDGRAWIRRGLGIWGSRHWMVVDPATGNTTEVILPLDLEVRWASKSLVIGIAQGPGRPGRMVLLQPG